MSEPGETPHVEAHAGLAAAHTSVLPEPVPDNEENED
jgi:hypothetical protein